MRRAPEHPGRSPASRSREGGFSLSEIAVTISIIGVLATVCVMMMTGIVVGSKEAIATAKLEQLNKAVSEYNYSNLEIDPNRLSVQTANTSDEQMVLNALKYRDPVESKAAIGSPFILTDYNPVPSSSADDYRLMWAGRIFKLLKPGAAGTGFKVVFDGSDMTPGTPHDNKKPDFGS